jgi:hypothetical protein
MAPQKLPGFELNQKERSMFLKIQADGMTSRGLVGEMNQLSEIPTKELEAELHKRKALEYHENLQRRIYAGEAEETTDGDQHLEAMAPWSNGFGGRFGRGEY